MELDNATIEKINKIKNNNKESYPENYVDQQLTNNFGIAKKQSRSEYVDTDENLFQEEKVHEKRTYRTYEVNIIIFKY